MESQLKQRIVGGIVVACVIAIFLPILLHKPKNIAVKSAPAIIPKPVAVSEMSVQLQTPTQTQTPAAPVTTAASAPTPSAKNKTVVVVKQPSAPPAVAVKRQTKPVAHHVKRVAHVSHHTRRVAARPVDKKTLKASMAPPLAWVVQLGSFSNKQNAGTLVSSLRKQGYDAYSRHTVVNHHHITQVFVGPQINHNKIVKVQKQLDKIFHLKGVVRKYRV